MENNGEWTFGKRFPKEQKAPTGEDVRSELTRFGISEAETIRLIDTTHGTDDVRLNFIVDKRCVLRFTNAPDMTEQRFAERNRLIGRYKACGLQCPAFLIGTDGRYLHAWENLLCYCSEYIDLRLADEVELNDANALWDEIHDFEAGFAERFRDVDLCEAPGMYSLFDLNPFDVPLGVDEKQQNFNALIKKLGEIGEQALADRLIARHDAIRAKLHGVYRTLPRIFTQDDANPSNVLIDEQQHFAGLIDFNLAGTEVIVNTFANTAGGDYCPERTEPIGAETRLDHMLQEYRRDIARMLSIYHASEAEKQALALYAWIAMVAQWPLYCWLSDRIEKGGAIMAEVLELLGLLADLDIKELLPNI